MSMMSPEELESLANNIVKNLKKDLILDSEFGVDNECFAQNTWQRRKLLLIKIMTAINVVRYSIASVSCFFPSNDLSKRLRFFCGDLMLGLNSFGCFFNQMYLLGQLFIFSFLLIIQKNERSQQLHVISHIKKVKKLNLTSDERQSFAIFLKIMMWLRMPLLYFCAIPLTIIYLIGGVITTISLQSKTFAFISVLVILEMFPLHYFGLHSFVYGFLLVAHSSKHLEIQFHRLFLQIQELQRSGREKAYAASCHKIISLKLKIWADKGHISGLVGGAG